MLGTLGGVYSDKVKFIGPSPCGMFREQGDAGRY